MSDKPKSALDSNRIIVVNGTINEHKTELVINKLLEFESDNPKKDIVMIIDSYGGHVDSFFAIHDTMKLCRCDIATLCIGKAMSCGQMILMSGTKGKRFATPYSRILIHELSMYSEGKLLDVSMDVQEAERQQNQINELLYKYTKLTSKHLDGTRLFDIYLDPKKALKFGIIDHIVTKSDVFYGKLK